MKPQLHLRWVALSFFSSLLCLSAAEPKIPSFKTVEIDSKIGIGYGVTVADVDGDKKPDILLVDKDEIAWYQNPSWQKHVIATRLTPQDHVCIAAADIDGDGKAEIAVGAGWNPNDTVNSGAVFYLVAPKDRTQKWEAIKLPHEPTVHRMRWLRNSRGKHDLVVVPLHGRGNSKGAGDGVKVLAYTVPENTKDEWKTTVIDDSMHMTHNFHPVKWTRQSAGEFLLAGKEGVFHIVPSGINWSRRQVIGNSLGATSYPGAGEVREGNSGALNRFIATIEPMHGDTLALYTPPQELGSSGLWIRRELDKTLIDGHALACGDLGGNTFDQIVVGWRAMGKAGAKVGIKLFTPLDETLEGWKETLIDDNTMACEDLCLADLDGDGRLDIIAAGRATKNVKIYFNQGPK